MGRHFYQKWPTGLERWGQRLLLREREGERERGLTEGGEVVIYHHGKNTGTISG